MTAYWCELAWLGGERAEAGVVVEIEGERIESVEPDVTELPPGAEVLRGLTLPGFCNAHSHAFHRALRSRSQGERGSFWTWREQMYALANKLDPDRYRALATAVFAEMALAGITAVGEFHYVHHGPGGAPYDDPNEMGRALVQAAAEAGLRITLLDTCYLQAGDGRAPERAQRRFADRDVDAWAERVELLSDLGGHARPGAAIHSVRAVDPASCATVASWATERAVPSTPTSRSSPPKTRRSRRRMGSPPLGVLAQAGALTERFSAVHFTHTSPADVAALGRRKQPRACVRPPSGTSPTGSAQREPLPMRERRSRSARTPTQSSTTSPRCGLLSSTSAW